MFVPMSNPRPQSDVGVVLRLVEDGFSDYEVARRTGVPRSTVLRWRRGGVPSEPSGDRCEECGQAPHDFAGLRPAVYAYLLAEYLGDGTIFPTGGSWALRISNDAQYPGIIGECCAAIEAIRGRPASVRYHATKRMADVGSTWKSWPCLLPQHGPGRKHQRKIALVPWQVELVEAAPGHFLRGLIHSDGWRGLNRVRVKGRDYAYPRYQFSNRSDDIRALFTYACDLVGVAWRPWGRFHISVARHDAVEFLDRFVGPKF
jgi:hypothetical protein